MITTARPNAFVSYPARPISRRNLALPLNDRKCNASSRSLIFLTDKKERKCCVSKLNRVGCAEDAESAK